MKQLTEVQASLATGVAAHEAEVDRLEAEVRQKEEMAGIANAEAELLAANLAGSKVESEEALQALADARTKAEESERGLEVASRLAEEEAAFKIELQAMLEEEAARRMEFDAATKAKTDELANAKVHSE